MVKLPMPSVPTEYGCRGSRKDLGMHDIEMYEMTEAFFPCWKAAGLHLSKQVDGGIQSWLRAHPYPPFLEHCRFASAISCSSSVSRTRTARPWALAPSVGLLPPPETPMDTPASCQ